MKDMTPPNVSLLRQVPTSGERVTGPRLQDSGPGFKEKLSALQNAPAAAKSSGSAPLRFSNHAIDRMQARGIRFSPDEMSRIENAVSRAQAKGAKETLLLTDSSALIVSVKDNTVVTVMDKAALKDNVFTNIDSTVMI